MPIFLLRYMRAVDAVNRRIGRVVMFGIFVMMAILLWSSISKQFFHPSLWTLEMAQFCMVAYYLLGGPYSIQMGDHVRMDLFYADWSLQRKAWFDAFTCLFLLFYLGVLLYGRISSSVYAIEYGERAHSVWRPYMWPVKVVATFGIFLMFLQATAELIRDVARVRGLKV